MGKKIDNKEKSVKKRKKEECIVAESKDIHDYPIYGEGDNTSKTINKSKKTGLLILFLVLILGVSSFFVIDAVNKNNFKVLEKNYDEYVITRKDTSIYNKNKKEIGSISGDVKLVLTSIKTLSSKDKYLKIDGTDYYVYYKDIKKSKKDNKIEDVSYYIDLGIDITSKDKVELYKDKKCVITLNNGINASVKYMDNEYYYINFFNDIYKVKKSNSIVEKENISDVKYADHVSVLYYDLIDDNCSNDTCFKTASVKAHINKIKDAGYYSISKDDYLAYINGYIKLKENAIVFAVGNINDNSTSIENELDIKFANFQVSDGISFTQSNKTSKANDNKDAINMYLAKKYFVIDEYVRIANGEDVIDNGSTYNANQSVAVVNYHFFTNKEKDIICVPYESICLEESYFRSHLDYLKENNYKTLTIHEFSDWMDGIIEIPEKSILITVDDGAKGTGAHNGNILIPVLEEYQMHATLFLIAGWWDISNYQSPYLDIQSHTFDMHGGASGRKILSLPKDDIKEDIKKSLDVIQDNTTFCYPFYEYDDKSIQALQELGVKYAFAGGSRHAKRSDNHYIVPRYPIVGDVTKQEFANMIN